MLVRVSTAALLDPNCSPVRILPFAPMVRPDMLRLVTPRFPVTLPLAAWDTPAPTLGPALPRKFSCAAAPSVVASVRIAAALVPANTVFNVIRFPFLLAQPVSAHQLRGTGKGSPAYEQFDQLCRDRVP